MALLRPIYCAAPFHILTNSEFRGKVPHVRWTRLIQKQTSRQCKPVSIRGGNSVRSHRRTACKMTEVNRGAHSGFARITCSDITSTPSACVPVVTSEVSCRAQLSSSWLVLCAGRSFKRYGESCRVVKWSSIYNCSSEYHVLRPCTCFSGRVSRYTAPTGVEILSSTVPVLLATFRSYVTPSVLQVLWEIADIDAKTAGLLAKILQPFLSIGILLMIIRIVLSWYPQVDIPH